MIATTPPTASNAESANHRIPSRRMWAPTRPGRGAANEIAPLTSNFLAATTAEPLVHFKFSAALIAKHGSRLLFKTAGSEYQLDWFRIRHWKAIRSRHSKHKKAARQQGGLFFKGE